MSKILSIAILTLVLPSCMTSTDAKGNTVRKVDPEARKFYGGLLVRGITVYASQK